MMTELPISEEYIILNFQDIIMNDVIMNALVNDFEESFTYFSIIFNQTYKRFFLRNDSIEKDFESNVFIRVKFYVFKLRLIQNVTERNLFIIGEYHFTLEIIPDCSLKIEYGYLKGNKNTKYKYINIEFLLKIKRKL